MAAQFEKLLEMLDEEQLERFVMAYSDHAFVTVRSARREGRKGQSQNGVDVSAVLHERGLVGYQAKAYKRTKLTSAAIDAEIAKAHNFSPPLEYFTIVTLNARTRSLQEHARKQLLHGKKNRIEVLGVDDLADVVSTNDALRKLLGDFTLSDILPLYTNQGADASLVSTKLLSVEPEGALSPELRTIEDWINAGFPKKALALLGGYAGPESDAARVPLESKARFYLKEYATVTQLGKDESTKQSPDVVVLCIGAQAAAELEDRDSATALLKLAYLKADEKTKINAEAVYVRIRGYDGTASMSELEEHATETLGGANHATQSLGRLNKVAPALADVASQLGELDRAMHWYGVARADMPVATLGLEVNEATAGVLHAVEQWEAGLGLSTEVNEPLRKLEALLEKAKSSEAPGIASVVLSTIGFAKKALGDVAAAVASWDDALAYGPNEALWVHRNILCTNFGAALPDEHLILVQATTPLAKLVLASALTAAGRVDEARSWIEQVLSDPEAAAHHDLAEVELLRIQKTAGDTNTIIEKTISLLEMRPGSFPIVGWAILNFAVASPTQRERIKDAIRALDIEAMEDERLLAFAATLVDNDLPDLALPWINRLEHQVLGASDTITDFHAAGVLADIHLAGMRYASAIALRRRMLELRPDKASSYLLNAKALYESGAREEAYQTMTRGLRNGIESSVLLLNWAMLASSLGHRRQAAQWLKGQRIAAGATPDDFTRWLQAQTILGVQGHHEDILAGLRNQLITPNNAGAIFGIGLKKHPSQFIPVTYGTIVKLQVDGSAVQTIHIAENPTSLPGIPTFDSINQPWVADLIGARSGDNLLLRSGIFQGKSAQILEVRDATDWLVQEALALIQVSEPKVTGVEPMQGDLKQHLEKTRAHLLAHQKAVNESMTVASSVKVPIVFLAEKYNTSARKFLRAHAGWKPTGHPGDNDSISADDEALRNAKGLLFDPVALLLLMEIGAEDFIESLPVKPAITRQAAWQLKDWYLDERESRRARAYMSVGPDGRLVWTEFRSRDRVALLKFWRKLNTIVLNHFEIIETPEIDVIDVNTELIQILGPPTISGLYAAKATGRVLISEELLIRGASKDIFSAAAASLHRLVTFANEKGWLSKTKAVTAHARLINLGWGWISFPTWMLAHSLRMVASKGWSVADELLRRMRVAEPSISLTTLIDALRSVDNGEVNGMDSAIFRKKVFEALPRIPTQARKNIAARYAGPRSNRNMRATQKMLYRWASERIELTTTIA